MKRVLKWIGIVLGTLVVIVILAASALYVNSGRKLSKKYVVAPDPALVIPNDSAGIARGKYLVSSLPCGECHGVDLGGKVFADAGPFALLAGPNLTRGRGGRSAPLSDADWEHAIRHGVRQDSTSLLIMPSEVFNAIVDAEMAPMIAYLKQLPPVDREVPPTRLRILGRLLLGAGQFHLQADTTPTTPHRVSVDTTASVEYGRYLASVSGCDGCHGASFSGGPGFGGPGAPPAANITPTGIGKWTESDFMHAMHDGVRPIGTKISELMPWKAYGHRSDNDLRAIWMYLQTVPPKDFEQR